MAETTSFSSLFDSVDSFIRSGGGDVGALDAKLDDAFAPDVKFHVTGQPGGYQLATDAEGIPAVKDYFLKVMGPAMITAIDFTKPFTNEIVNVIGGHGGEWSAAEMKEMGTGKNGEPWNLEAIFAIKTNAVGKVSELRVYADTLHLQSHWVQ